MEHYGVVAGRPAGSLLPDLAAGFVLDCKRYSLLVAVLRTFRASRYFTKPRALAEMTSLPAIQAHMAHHELPDPVFFLSHRHYLARGLSPRARVRAAVSHYRHESTTYAPAYLEQVYSRDGLVLWREAVDGVAYDVRLMAGNDVLHEGGLSVVFHVDGGRVHILSFSMIPASLILPAGVLAQEGLAPSSLIPFISRRQLAIEAQDGAYEAAFNKAFARTTPAHLCLGALTGLALAQGVCWMVGVEPERQIAFTKERQPVFERAYADLWTSVGGRKASPFGYLMEAPLRFTPLEELSASQRKRAKARRGFVDAVRASAQATIEGLLRSTEEFDGPKTHTYLNAAE